MTSDRNTSSDTQPLEVSWSAEPEPRSAALSRAGVRDDELPQPALGDQVGRYTVLSRLGQGGMGVVYKAYDPQLDRNVALKLLRRVLLEDEQGSELRLLREAQMLAQLQHPNVVAVFDAGLAEHGVFIAMELVEGQTLRKWLHRSPRSVAQILTVFRAAGQGLAAAHEAGFVHRDFKPSNVIVGDDGSVRVLDFGVASLMDPHADSLGGSASISRREVARPPGAAEPLSSSDAHLTEAGVVLGTPAYMAPEQIVGAKADHRSEQFTFCVCLHLALYGHSPVLGESYDERRWNTARGRVLDERGMLTGRTPGRVPARVRRVLRRGLSVSPAARFESMRALLDALDEPPRRRSRWAAGSMLLFGFGAGAMAFDAQRDPCVEPVAALEQVWDDDARQAIRDAFVRSGHPRSDELRDRVEHQLDDYAKAWAGMYTESCRATFVSRQQSERLHDQRLRCLERRRNRMRSAIEALGRVADPQQAISHTLLPFQLPLIADCADLEAVSAALPLPAEARQRQRIASIRRTIDEVETLKGAGEFEAGIELGRAVVDRARQLELSPVLAEALGTLGSLQAMGGSALEAQATLEASILEASKAGDDATAAKAWTWLLYALVLQRRLEEGKSIELAASASVERADLDEVRGWLLNNLGALYGANGSFEQALDYLVRALEVKQRTMGFEHVDVGISWFNLGTALVEQQRYAEAHDALARARVIFEGTVGQAHPLTFHAIGGLCQVEYERGRYATAIELCGRVLAHYELSPTSHVTMGRNSFLMAQALEGVGRREEARGHARRALALVRTEDPQLAEQIERWIDRVPQAQPRGRR